jgi:hypothetical protein
MSDTNVKNIEFTGDEVRELIQLYNAKADSVAKEIEELQLRQRAIHAMLNKLSHSLPKPENSYSPDWPWALKITYVLKRVNKVVKSKDIVDFMYDLESEILNDIEPKDKYIKSVSATISQKVGTTFKRIKESEEEGGEYLVGLSEWSDDKFEVKNKGSLFGSLTL